MKFFTNKQQGQAAHLSSALYKYFSYYSKVRQQTNHSFLTSTHLSGKACLRYDFFFIWLLLLKLFVEWWLIVCLLKLSNQLRILFKTFYDLYRWMILCYYYLWKCLPIKNVCVAKTMNIRVLNLHGYTFMLSIVN